MSTSNSERIITLFDIKTNDAQRAKAMSCNVWKTRLALNIKGLPHKSIWLEASEIEPRYREIGMPTTLRQPGAVPSYTCPAIIDTSRGALVSDSIKIAEYLDQTYPDTPTLFPKGTKALQAAFVSEFESKIYGSIRPFAVPRVFGLLNPVSQEYMRASREAMFGKKIEDIDPKGDERVEQWKKVRETFDAVNVWYKKGDDDGPFLLGEKPGFADTVVVGFLEWMRVIFGEDSTEWNDIASWNNGRWSTIRNSLKRYMVIQ